MIFRLLILVQKESGPIARENLFKKGSTQLEILYLLSIRRIALEKEDAHRYLEEKVRQIR